MVLTLPWGNHAHTLHVSFLPELHYDRVVELGAVEENPEVGRGVVVKQKSAVSCLLFLPVCLQVPIGMPKDEEPKILEGKKRTVA